MKRMRVVAVLAGLTLAAGCGGPEAPAEAPEASTRQGLSWEQFRASVLQDDQGIFIVDGDTPVEGEEALREFYERYVRDPARAARESSELARSQQGLILNSAGRWSDTTKLNLTYCVSKQSFGTRYTTVVNAMASAAAAWEGAANINFIHRSAYDSNCNQYQTAVLFDVRQYDFSGGTLARAFFPGASRSSRNVLIDPSAFSSSRPSLTGILRHELGHVLGWRHEHTRPEAGACFEDWNWYELTSYDPYSAMHYVQCNGKGDGYLNLTSTDKYGAARVYGYP